MLKLINFCVIALLLLIFLSNKSIASSYEQQEYDRIQKRVEREKQKADKVRQRLLGKSDNKPINKQNQSLSDSKKEVVQEQKPQNDVNKLYKITAIDGHFYVDAQINGKIIKFMIDTGASDIVLNDDDAKTLGIKTYLLRYDKVYLTAMGEIKNAPYILEKIKIGEIEVNNINASISRLTQEKMGISLLGASFLNRLSSYKFTNNILTLQQ